MSNETAAPGLTLDIERTGNVVIVKCHGRLVSGTTDILYSRLCKQIPGAKRMVLDLGDLTYMDSMGLGTLARLYASTKSAGCSLELVHLGKRVRELLSLTNMLSVFTIIGENGTMIRF
jgi:anti-sigma B factor antagonist